MDLELYKSGDIIFIELEGSMNVDSANELRDMVMEAMAASRAFVINISKVPRMDKSCIDTLVSLVRHVRVCDGEVKLVGLSADLKKSIESVSPEPVFDVYDKTQQAVDALNATPVATVAGQPRLF